MPESHVFPFDIAPDVVGRDGPETLEASYLLAFFARFFGFALRGCGGALRILRSASSNGIGVRSGFGGFAFMVGV
jgi:hypothetical protein